MELRMEPFPSTAEAGTTDSSPMDIVAVGDNVFFFADDGVHG